jgi:PAS domain S-box-containing protein
VEVEKEDSMGTAANPIHPDFAKHGDLLTAFFASAPEPFAVAGFDGVLQCVNPAFTALLGYTEHEVAQTHFLEFVHPEDRERTRAEFERRIRGGEPRPFACRWRTKSGGYVTLDWRGAVDSARGLAYGCARDITEAAAAHPGTPEDLRNLALDAEIAPFFDLSLDMLCITGPDGFFLRVNPAFERGLGYPSGELVSRPFTEFLHPDDLERTRQEYADQLRGKEVFRFENRYRHKNGEYRWLSWTGAPQAKSGRIYAVAREITEQKEAERSLRDSRDTLDALVKKRTQVLERALERIRSEHERYLDLLHSAPVGIVVHRDDRPLFANPAFAHLFGFAAPDDVVAAGGLLPLFAPDDRLRLQEHRDRLLGGDPDSRPFELRGVRKDGRALWVETVSTLTHWEGLPAVLETYQDTTEKRSLQEQLSHAQKLDSIGQLAGGVAHDFNNVLSVIISYSEMLGERFASDAEARSDLDQILEAAKRAAALTRQLLAFSRRQVLNPQVVNLNEVLAGVQKMLVRLIGEDVELSVRPAAGLGLIRADVHQLEQVLMNLAVNARDAMPEGGTLAVETVNVTLDEGYVRRNIGVNPGDYVMLAVSDTGMGMPPEVQARIFEPFFTTKEKGKGTGLGLATVHGIVKQSGGEIHVYSEPGVGTTFRLYFPRLPAGTECAAPAEARETGKGGTETILLVEDEEQVRRVAHRILQMAGYRVLEARNGAQAVEISNTSQEHIQLLITDVVMPGASGRELAQQLTSARAGLRVLYMSGYTEDVILKRGILTGEVRFVEKPFSKETLLRKVRETLDVGP